MGCFGEFFGMHRDSDPTRELQVIINYLMYGLTH